LDILDDREKEVVIGRFGLEHGGEERTVHSVKLQKSLASPAPMFHALRSER
jgi:DNA-directed RNA polymerase sigma subunit (sigma70/sigma32)